MKRFTLVFLALAGCTTPNAVDSTDILPALELVVERHNECGSVTDDQRLTADLLLYQVKEAAGIESPIPTLPTPSRVPVPELND